MKTSIDKSSARSGFALLLVMICILTLASLVWVFSISMKTEMTLARNADYDQEMEWMGRSGIEMARFALANKCPEQRNIDALNQFWAGGSAPCSNNIPQFSLKDYALGSGKISVTIVDMERKWSIFLATNPRAPQRDVLQRALTIVGVTDSGQISTIEDSILDWCSPYGSAGFSGAKDDYYKALNPPYYCKNGPIDDLSELLLIKGITPEIYWGSNATNHPVSAYQQHGGGAFDQPTSSRSGGFRNQDEPVYPHGLQELFAPMGGKLNINTASALTLQLAGFDESTAARIVQQRAGPDGIDGTEDDIPFQNPGEINGGNVQGAPQNGTNTQAMASYLDVRSVVFDVLVEAEINGYKRTFHGIVSRSGQSGQQLKCVKFYWE